MRVRDVEIALVLAREMKDAAARDVDASLRLEQLKEVFGADELDAGERARIQTALQMAGLEPQPSLLEADPSAPIRFGVAGTEAPAPVEAAPPAEERHELFGRFRRKRRAEVVTVTEPEPEPELPAQDADADADAEEEAPVANGHVDVETNGHSQIDLDDVALPPHDFDDPPVEEELLYEEEEEEWEAEPEAEPEPEPVPVAEPAPQAARVEEIAALLLPLVALPVLIASFAGWSFGLPFVALSVIATGVLAGRRAGFFSTLRESPAARTILRTTLLVTAASLAIAIVLANVDTGGGKAKPKQPAAAKKPTPPAAAAKHAAPAPKPSHKPRNKARTTPASPAPDSSTKGLIRVPPPSQSQTQTQTQTTPAPQQQTP